MSPPFRDRRRAAKAAFLHGAAIVVSEAVNWDFFAELEEEHGLTEEQMRAIVREVANSLDAHAERLTR